MSLSLDSPGKVLLIILIKLMDFYKIHSAMIRIGGYPWPALTISSLSRVSKFPHKGSTRLPANLRYIHVSSISSLRSARKTIK